MEKTTFNKSDGRSADGADLGADYANALDMVTKSLNADTSDLQHLLGFITAKSVSLSRIPAILKLAFSNLHQLRQYQPVLGALDGLGAQITDLLRQIGQALKTGETLSLRQVDHLLEEAANACSDGPSHNIAHMLAAHALTCAAMQDFERAADIYGRAAALPDLDLPDQWQYQNKRALALVDLGRDYSNIEVLQRAVTLYETTVAPLAACDQMPSEWARTRSNLGDVLGILGQRHRGTHLLEKSIESYQQALSQFDRDEHPREWATAQNNLGNALGALGQRQGLTELLEQSIGAFELALTRRSQDIDADEWATTQNNLGAALQAFGQREKATRQLSKSVAAFTKVLKVWTQKRNPVEWAATLNNLGTVLRILGERQSGNRSLEKSVAAFQNALKVRTFEQMPQDWALTQNNLGAALQKLAERLEGDQLLQQSVQAYENALTVWTREAMPMGWTMTKANLGVARRELAERTMDIDTARAAVADISAVTEFFRDASHAQYRELSEEQLTTARLVVAELGG